MHTVTHNIASHSTNKVDEANPEPANSALDLNANIELDGDDDDNVDNTKMDEGRREPAPELLSCGAVWIAVLVTDTHSIEGTHITKTIDLWEQHGQ